MTNANKDDGVTFSIIVPVYNVEKYLSNCVDSVISQTYGKWELVLIDDGSVDRSKMLVDEYTNKDKRIIGIHQKNCGMSAARNRGIKIARGEYIMFLDSDDWIEHDTLSNMVSVIQSRNADIVSFNIIREVNGKQKFTRAEESVGSITQINNSMQQLRYGIGSYGPEMCPSGG